MSKNLPIIDGVSLKNTCQDAKKKVYHIYLSIPGSNDHVHWVKLAKIQRMCRIKVHDWCIIAAPIDARVSTDEYELHRVCDNYDSIPVTSW